MRRLLPTLLALTAAALAPAQPTDQTPRRPSFEELPPMVQLGVRVETLRQAWSQAPVVVIAPDAETALDAIGMWTPSARFPVLIDDGSAQAREDIARFVRAYEPERVLTIPAPDMRVALAPSSRVEQLYARVWGVASAEELPARWKATRVTPPGIVAADESDAAWIAAAALAIGRGQALVWADAPPGALGRTLREGEVAALDEAIRARLDELDLDWREIGDTVDAVTLCMNIAARIEPPDEKGPRALTDRIGRHADGERWAWTGQVLGDASASLYRAMSSLFLLHPERAWFFDGYQDEAPYNRYGVGGGAKAFEEAGLATIVDAPPAGSLGQWLRRGRTAIDAGFIHVNTAGHRRWFNLNPGRAYGRDVPLLERPAAVHFIHSFSAQDPGDGMSIAGTWLDRGAFCYFGAMDEPFLGAFLPPEPLARRLLSAVPWGAAVRADGPLWKVNTFGDPLYTMSRIEARTTAAPEIAEASRLADQLRAALDERDLGAAGRTLALLGRDDDLLQLARATLGDEETETPDALADAALYAAARAGERDLIAPLFDSLSIDRQEDARVREVVWLALRPELSGEPSVDTLAVLQRCAGGASLARDAEQLARAMARVVGPEAGAGYLQSVASNLENDRDRRRLESVADELLK